MYWYQRHRNPRSDDIWEKMLGAAHATDPELAQWMEDNAPTLKQMVADKISASETPDIPVYTEMESVTRPSRSEIRREDMPLEEVAEDYVVVTRPTVETLEGAKAWVREAAQMLAELPVPHEPTNIIGYEGRTPIHDGIGLSGSTAGPIRKFAAMLPQDGDEDLPIDVYQAALEYLRSHSRSQLNRASFDEALDIISSEDAALDIEAAKDLLKSGVLAFSSKRGRTTEGSWERADEGGILLTTNRKNNFKLSNDIIVRGTGLIKGRDFRWVVERDQYGGKTFRLLVMSHALDTFLSWFQQGYPNLSATIYPYLEELELEQEQEQEQDAPAIPWELDTDQFRLLLDVGKAGLRANEFAYEFNQIPKWLIKDGEYWSNISLEDLPAFRALLAEKRGAFWEALLEEVDANIDEWMSHKASLKQTKEEGYAPGGRWKRLPNNKFVVRTDYLQKIRGFKNTYPGGDQPIRFEVSEKRMPKLADALRPHHPRLAEAITRAFGGVAQIAEEEAAFCGPLIHLSNKLDPRDVTDEAALQAIAAVEEGFALRGPDGLGPYPYQVNGIAFAKLTNYRGVIGDAMGLGKTIQALGAIITDPNENLPALVIAPASVIYGAWVPESKLWLQKLNVPVIVLKSGQMPPPGFGGVAIASWDFLRDYIEELIEVGFKLFIADEAHYGKGGKRGAKGTGRGDAMIDLADSVPHVLLLTGTPIKNVVSELWPLLSAVDSEIWGKGSEFKRKYSILEESGRFAKEVGAKNVQDLRNRLACTMIRRFKKDALPDLPPMTRETLKYQLTPEDRAKYDYAMEEFATWLREHFIERMKIEAAKLGKPVEQLTREHLAEIMTSVRRSLRAKAIVKLGKARQIVGIAKAKQLAPLIRKLARDGEPTLLWAQHKSVVKALERMLNEEGVTYGVISGSVDNEDRGQIAQDFQKGLFQVLVVTQAAKEGLTLTRANRAYFIERYWTPADEAQAEARIWRIGQTRPTTNYYLLVPGTVDQKMADIIDAKRETIDDVLGDEDIEKVYNISAQQELLDDLAEQEGMLEGLLPTGALRPPEAVKNPRQRGLFAQRNPVPKQKWTLVLEGDPLRDEIREDLYNLVEETYAPIGGHVKISSPQSLDKYRYWIVKDLDSDPSIDIGIFGKPDIGGAKLGGVGHDGSRLAKSAYKAQSSFLSKGGEICTEDECVGDWWGEVSGRPAAALIKRGAPSIRDESSVRRLLKDDAIEWHGYHPGYPPDSIFNRAYGWYSKRFSDGSTHTKIIMGSPRL